MLDIPSLILLAGLFLGVLAGDAALYGDTLRVQLSVPSSLSSAGFNEASAEQLFSAEAERIVSGESFIPAPMLRVNSAPSIFAALAKPLNLDGLVVAMQYQFGVDHMQVTGALLQEAATGPADQAAGDTAAAPKKGDRSITNGKPLDLLLVITKPHQTVVQVRLTQSDGDAVKLVRRGAAWAMEQVSPYRVALAHMIAGVRGEIADFAAAKEVATRALRRPWDPAEASARVMMHNILGVIAMLDNNLQEADLHFRETKVVPDVAPGARGLITLNRALIALANKQPAQAQRYFAEAQSDTSAIRWPSFQANIAVEAGLIAWAQGDQEQAEREFRAVIGGTSDNKAAHYYLSRLLAAKGDTEGAMMQRKAADISFQFDEVLPGMGITLFWIDPVNGGIQRQD